MKINSRLCPLWWRETLLVSTIGILSCTCQIAAANPSLANKTLAQLSSKSSPKTIRKIKSQHQMRSLKPVSKFDRLIKTAKTISHAGGVFGKNVKPVISKDGVGFQYSTKW